MVAGLRRCSRRLADPWKHRTEPQFKRIISGKKCNSPAKMPQSDEFQQVPKSAAAHAAAQPSSSASWQRPARPTPLSAKRQRVKVTAPTGPHFPPSARRCRPAPADTAEPRPTPAPAARMQRRRCSNPFRCAAERPPRRRPKTAGQSHFKIVPRGGIDSRCSSLRV